MTWSARALTVNGAKAPYLETGDSHSPHVLLLVHAFPVGMRMWEPVVVPEGWRAVAPALPGFDGTEPPPRNSTSIDDYARFVLAFMDELRIDSAVVGGLSMGGYVSFALWRLDHLRWRGLVLADTKAGADTEQGRQGREQLLATIASQGTHGVAEAMLPKLLGGTTRAKRPAVVDHVRRLIERQTNEGVSAAVVRLRDRPDSTPLLAEIGVPTLVVVGEEDEVTPAKESEAMQAALPDARLERIAQAGHLSCIENPQAFNAALGSFLSAIRR
jgi:3-oxoadipate enol-lactonase